MAGIPPPPMPPGPPPMPGAGAAGRQVHGGQQFPQQHGYQVPHMSGQQHMAPGTVQNGQQHYPQPINQPGHVAGQVPMRPGIQTGNPQLQQPLPYRPVGQARAGAPRSPQSTGPSQQHANEPKFEGYIYYRDDSSDDNLPWAMVEPRPMHFSQEEYRRRVGDIKRRRQEEMRKLRRDDAIDLYFGMRARSCRTRIDELVEDLNNAEVYSDHEWLVAGVEEKGRPARLRRAAWSQGTEVAEVRVYLKRVLRSLYGAAPSGITPGFHTQQQVPVQQQGQMPIRPQQQAPMQGQHPRGVPPQNMMPGHQQPQIMAGGHQRPGQGDAQGYPPPPPVPPGPPPMPEMQGGFAPPPMPPGVKPKKTKKKNAAGMPNQGRPMQHPHMGGGYSDEDDFIGYEEDGVVNVPPAPMPPPMHHQRPPMPPGVNNRPFAPMPPPAADYRPATPIGEKKIKKQPSLQNIVNINTEPKKKATKGMKAERRRAGNSSDSSSEDDRRHRNRGYASSVFTDSDGSRFSSPSSYGDYPPPPGHRRGSLYGIDTAPHYREHDKPDAYYHPQDMGGRRGSSRSRYPEDDLVEGVRYHPRRSSYDDDPYLSDRARRPRIRRLTAPVAPPELPWRPRDEWMQRRPNEEDYLIRKGQQAVNREERERRVRARAWDAASPGRRYSTSDYAIPRGRMEGY